MSEHETKLRHPVCHHNERIESAIKNLELLLVGQEKENPLLHVAITQDIAYLRTLLVHGDAAQFESRLYRHGQKPAPAIIHVGMAHPIGDKSELTGIEKLRSLTGREINAIIDSQNPKPVSMGYNVTEGRTSSQPTSIEFGEHLDDTFTPHNHD